MPPSETRAVCYSVCGGNLSICCVVYALELVDLLLSSPAGPVSLKNSSFPVVPFQSQFLHCSVLSPEGIAHDSRSIRVTEYPTLDSERRRAVMSEVTEGVMIVVKWVQKGS